METPLGQLLSATRDFDRNGSYYEANLNALDVLLAVQPGTYRADLSADASIPAAPGLV